MPVAETVALNVRLNSDGTGLVVDDLGEVARAFEQLGGKIDKADDRQQKSRKTTADLTQAMGGLRTVVSAAASAFAALGVGLTIDKFIDVAIQTSRMEASLKTFTGSAQSARDAFDQLQDFASRTPFALEQSVEAFIRMKSLGLDPTEDALMSFANVAAATGKDLIQFVEAVADAATNEFERLKEFGIKARQETDAVVFTVQGAEFEVEKSAKAITAFLQQVGETTFAGAAQDQMDSLVGAFSQLEDSVTNHIHRGRQRGAFDALKVAVQELTGVFETTEEQVSSLANAIDVAAIAGVESLALMSTAAASFFNPLTGAALLWAQLGEEVESTAERTHRLKEEAKELAEAYQDIDLDQARDQYQVLEQQLQATAIAIADARERLKDLKD